MPHNENLQKKLHEIRVQIVKLELQIDALLEERATHVEKIKKIDAKILALREQIALLSPP